MISKNKRRVAHNRPLLAFILWFYLMDVEHPFLLAQPADLIPWNQVGGIKWLRPPPRTEIGIETT
jgi:hypothetical protein